MSNSSRIEQLLQFAKEEPDNPFNLYALALEYQKTDPNQAVGYFEKLLSEHSDYLPTYYHAGALFTELEELEKAKATYESGIQLADKQENQHALRELKNAYQNFLFENDLG
ncbi:lipopolysaccharide assembly protein LapB [Echinicola sp. 20G]|uniref:tetratricopeptide repeat protein n=1 Tax=Echinicola sp. 20G TaxID=2781961 RepID=UPI0019105A43|nr:tetratricopeptide repeat protein [Echinicola sp. 20G]